MRNKVLPARSAGATRQTSVVQRRAWKKFIDLILTPLVGRLYRSRFRSMVGSTMAVLTHVGRRTGKIRRTVLYAQYYNPRTKELRLVAAFGITDWFLNICKQPALLVEVGDARYVPAHRILSVHEIAEIQRRFRQNHPLVARAQAWLMGWPWGCPEDEFLAFAESLRGVVLWPIAEPSAITTDLPALTDDDNEPTTSARHRLDLIGGADCHQCIVQE